MYAESTDYIRYAAISKLHCHLDRISTIGPNDSYASLAKRLHTINSRTVDPQTVEETARIISDLNHNGDLKPGQSLGKLVLGLRRASPSVRQELNELALRILRSERSQYLDRLVQLRETGTLPAAKAVSDYEQS